MTNLYAVPNASAGLDVALVDTINAVPSFTPYLLVFVWGLITLGGIILQYRTSRDADVPLWNLLGAIFTLIISTSMSIAFGLVNSTTQTIVIGFTILSFVWLGMSRGKFEPL